MSGRCGVAVAVVEDAQALCCVAALTDHAGEVDRGNRVVPVVGDSSRVFRRRSGGTLGCHEIAGHHLEAPRE